MCQRIGHPPISTIGFGFQVVSSCRRVPKPPASITTLRWVRIFFGIVFYCEDMPLIAVETILFSIRHSDIMGDGRTALLPNQVQHNAPFGGHGAMLEDVQTLPDSQRQLSLHHRN